MSTGGLYSAAPPATDRFPTGFLNPVTAGSCDAAGLVNGNSYVCLVPFFNRLVQNSAGLAATQGAALMQGNGLIQNSSLTGGFTPVLMETATQTPPVVSGIIMVFVLRGSDLYFISLRKLI